METVSAVHVNLELFYRFALLLGGDAKTAEQVLAAALSEMQTQEGRLRNSSNRQAWLISRIRQGCKTRPAAEAGQIGAPALVRMDDGSESSGLLEIEAYLFARRFSGLAEPGRSALALLYVDLVPVCEMAGVLGLSWDQLCAAQAKGREELRNSVLAMRSPELVLS